MTETIFKLLGGIGLFLMGMVMLTDGLKAFAGDSLRRALLRFTGRPVKAFAAGVIVTLLVQSSTATTLAVIGFVSAGMLTFPQAVGLVMGASLGTTGTGWIVAVLGLKISIGYYALPLVGVGAFIRLLGGGRWKPLGTALAGFGLLFVGIETLQVAMSGLSDEFDLARVPSTGLLGHLLMMVIGIVLTVVMQSSSAAVATTLTALHTGSVSFEQATSLVIGAAIGTTLTGVLAAIGGSTPARRTAAAHVLFNLATGLLAIVLLPFFLWMINIAQGRGWIEPGAMSLAAFHSGFIALGVAVFLPFAHQFAALVERLLPDRGPAVTRHLDPSLLNIPAVALETSRRAMADTAAELFDALKSGLSPAEPRDETPEATRARLEEALEAVRHFLGRIPPVNEDATVAPLRIAQIHALEHLARLLPFLQPPDRVVRFLRHDRLAHGRRLASESLQAAAAGLRTGQNGWVAGVAATSRALSEWRRGERAQLMESAAAAQWDTRDAMEAADAMRWLDSIGYHVWRISNYLGGDAALEPPQRPGETHPTD